MLSYGGRAKDRSADYAPYYTDAGWAAEWSIQYLGEAAVLEPQELREEIQNQPAALLEAYGENA